MDLFWCWSGGGKQKKKKKHLGLSGSASWGLMRRIKIDVDSMFSLKERKAW